MSQVERLVDDFLAREDRSRSWFSKQMGMSDKTLSSWFSRGRKSPLPPGAIKAMARVLEVDYRSVLDAVLYDSGYLPASSVVDLRDADDVTRSKADESPPVVVVESSDAPLERARRRGGRRSRRPPVRQ